MADPAAVCEESLELERIDVVAEILFLESFQAHLRKFALQFSLADVELQIAEVVDVTVVSRVMETVQSSVRF